MIDASQYLARAKRKDNDAWETGSLVVIRGETSEEQVFLADKMTGALIPVRSETVGRFTGLTDKNGKRIFEGDVIRYNTFDDFDCHSVMKFGKYEQDGSAGEYNPKSCVGWYCEVDNFTAPDWADENPTFFFNNYLKQQNLLEVNDECEVIGNIHDNPELLGGGNDGN